MTPDERDRRYALSEQMRLETSTRKIVKIADEVNQLLDRMLETEQEPKRRANRISPH